jgi:hypothetical protein
MSIPLLRVMCQHHVFVRTLFPVQGGLWTGTSVHWKQRTRKYMICCHITHNNGILVILIHDFSYELYVLLDDDMQCDIETCRSSESVLVKIILD